MVLVIVGILAAVVAPRFLDSSAFQARGFADQVQATLRFAQKTAIAQHRYVCAAFAANSVTLTTGATSACGINLLPLSGGTTYTVTAPSGITFTAIPAGFSFDALGRPSLASTQTIAVNGATISITVEAETGYVHQ